MSTATLDRARTKTPAPAIGRPEDHADVKAARRAQESARAQYGSARDTVARLNGELAAADERLDALALIRLRRELSDAEQVADVHQRVVARCDEQVQTALESARQEQIEPLRVRGEAVARRLNRQLEAAVAINEEARGIGREAVELLGHGRAAALGLTGIDFQPFADGSAGTGQSRLSAWREFIERDLGIAL